MDAAPTILYLDCRSGVDTHRRKLDGIRRYAVARGWEVATLDRRALEFRAAEVVAGIVAESLAQFTPVGCIVECSGTSGNLSPALFGETPVVYLDPPEPLPWREAVCVTCDNAAVARVAFRELALGKPPAFALVPYFLRGKKWADERAEAFVECCRVAGMQCHVFPGHQVASWRDAHQIATERASALADWAEALPAHCAIFAVNDHTSGEAARALAAAGRAVPRSATLVGADAAGDDADASGTVSSVRIDFEFAGYAAARMLAELTGRATARPAAHDTRRSTRDAREGHLQPRSGDLIGKAVFGPLLVERRQSTGGRGRRAPRILEAVEAIRREACDGLTVAALASRFPGSRRLFEMRFREAMGHSALDEILDVRLERALALLARSDVPIGAIAAFCGFGCDYELRKLFRARFGTSLRAWRKEHAR